MGDLDPRIGVSAYFPSTRPRPAHRRISNERARDRRIGVCPVREPSTVLSAQADLRTLFAGTLVSWNSFTNTWLQGL